MTAPELGKKTPFYKGAGKSKELNDK